jgi:hypothetical protein
MNIKHSGLWLLGLCTSVSVSACPDPTQRLADWRERSEPLRKAPEAGECAGIADITGTYLMGAAVIVNPGAPLRFKLELDVDTGAGTIDGTLQPIAVPPNNGETAPGTLVGEVYSASATIDAVGGTFSLDFGAVTVPLEANALLPTIATANLKLTGCTGSPQGSCGLIEGEITAPAEIPLAGSTWAIIEFDDPMTEGIETKCE